MTRILFVAIGMIAASPTMAQQAPADTVAPAGAPTKMSLADKAAALSAAAAPSIVALKGLAALFKKPSATAPTGATPPATAPATAP